LLAAVGSARGQSLVLRGEAGIGKTALLEYLVASASGMSVVRATGVESEMELAYASLHQLCGPLLDRLNRLPVPQRQAMEIVFGLHVGEVPDRFLVGLAVLSLFAEVAEQRPLLCVVDDAQWLDRSSALTLAFAARRLLAERVAIVFAAREPGEALRGVPELEVHGVPARDARALLGSAVGFKLDERVRERIVVETRGNPLALLELPRGLSATQLAGGFGLLDAPPLAERIEESFVRRLDVLSGGARRLLLLAAAEPIGDPLLLWRAADRLAIGPEAAKEVEAAETDGLLAMGEPVRFRHPLVRSAVYRSAPVSERRLVHRALAEATDRETDPDRRAWHLAASAHGPDEEVASELEGSAGRAQARGGLSAAAAFLRRAVVLSRDPVERIRRTFAAAQACLHAGAFQEALALPTTLDADSLDERQAARALMLRGEIAFAASMGTDAPRLLLEAAKRLEALDVELARETYLDAWGAALFAGRLATAGDLLAVSRAARSAPPAEEPLRPSDLLLDSLSTLIMDGPAASADMLRRATRAFRENATPTPENFRWGWMSTIPANVLWDEDSWDAINSRQVAEARDAGALARLPIDLSAWAILAAWRGDFSGAGAAIAEADAVTEATGTRYAPYAALLMTALRGREAEASAAIESVIREAGTGGQGIGVQWAEWLNAILYNGLGRYRRALTSAERATQESPQLFISLWALPEQVEASVRAGELEPARVAADRLAEATEAARTQWGLGMHARCRALVSDGHIAEDFYREAIERLGQTRLRTELARAHLLYGEWLRRQTRRVDAREQLQAAHDLFSAIGMEAFRERARHELEATGSTVRSRAADTRDELTAQERQIARLARDGLSNPEIGARLFLSPRTVEWHLRNVFGKLEIRSRRDLAEALPASDSQLLPA
jgi:DNA-binding CsgD family transcriptional regulator